MGQFSKYVEQRDQNLQELRFWPFGQKAQPQQTWGDRQRAQKQDLSKQGSLLPKTRASAREDERDPKAGLDPHYLGLNKDSPDAESNALQLKYGSATKTAGEEFGKSIYAAQVALQTVLKGGQGFIKTHKLENAAKMLWVRLGEVRTMWSSFNQSAKEAKAKVAAENPYFGKKEVKPESPYIANPQQPRPNYQQIATPAYPTPGSAPQQATNLKYGDEDVRDMKQAKVKADNDEYADRRGRLDARRR